MASATIGTKAVGSIVKIKINGVLTDFIIVHQGLPGAMYDSSCDGTWVLMKDCYTQRAWNTTNYNNYSSSDINAYLNGAWLNLVETNVKNQVKKVKIPWSDPESSYQIYSGANGLSCRVFLLSAYEVGITVVNSSTTPFIDGAKLACFDSGQDTNANNKRIAYYDATARDWWLRTPCDRYKQESLYIRRTGQAGNSPTSSSDFVRPAFILPKTLTIGDDGQLVFNTAPSTPGSIIIPEGIQGGTSVAVSWSASTDEQGNLEGYVVERSVNGGTSWTQIYQGSALSTANTVPFGAQSVMYRVKAYDSEGLSSGWRTSGAVTVVNNVAPSAPAGITLPEAVLGGQPLAIAWGAATDSDGNLSAYHLERSVDGSAWAEIYSGPDQNFTDSITKGWRTVAYRVRAADALGLFGDYAASPAREVDNNTAPVISCEQAGDLGEKNAGFTVGYHVSDEENDAVAVTEILDGTPKRTFQAGEGANSFAVTGESFMKLLNGPHAMLIRASDGKIAATHELTFTKLVTAASVTLAEPMGASEAITLCALSVSGGIPADAAFKVEVTNNANDESPAWEDCTTAVRNRLNHIFENKTAANGFAFNFRLHVERGESGQGGYITSIQGGFQ